MSSIKQGDAQGHEQAASADTGLEPSAAKGKKSPSPKNCRNFIRRKTANAMPDIVKTFVDKAKNGSVPHFTSLAKVGGFDQHSGATEAPKRKRRSLARQLLDEVERYEATQAAELAAANAASQIHDQIDNRSPQESS